MLGLPSPSGLPNWGSDVTICTARSRPCDDGVRRLPHAHRCDVALPSPVGVDDLLARIRRQLTQTDVEAMFATHPTLNRRGRSILRWDSEDEIDTTITCSTCRYPEPGVSGNDGTVSELHRPTRPQQVVALHRIDGLADGRFGTYFKVHHASSTGRPVKMSQKSLSADPNDDRIRDGAKRPDQRRTGAGADTASGTLVRRRRWRTCASRIGRSAAAQDRRLLPLNRAPRTARNVPSGPVPHLSGGLFQTSRVKAGGRRRRVTFNDVALTMTPVR